MAFSSNSAAAKRVNLHELASRKRGSSRVLGSGNFRARAAKKEMRDLRARGRPRGPPQHTHRRMELDSKGFLFLFFQLPCIVMAYLHGEMRSGARRFQDCFRVVHKGGFLRRGAASGAEGMFCTFTAFFP
jgi:hypothetical protein